MRMLRMVLFTQTYLHLPCPVVPVSGPRPCELGRLLVITPGGPPVGPKCKQTFPLDCCYPSFTSPSQHFARHIQRVNPQPLFDRLSCAIHPTQKVPTFFNWGFRSATATRQQC